MKLSFIGEKKHLDERNINQDTIGKFVEQKYVVTKEEYDPAAYERHIMLIKEPTVITLTTKVTDPKVTDVIQYQVNIPENVSKLFMAKLVRFFDECGITNVPYGDYLSDEGIYQFNYRLLDNFIIVGIIEGYDPGEIWTNVAITCTNVKNGYGEKGIGWTYGNNIEVSGWFNRDELFTIILDTVCGMTNDSSYKSNSDFIRNLLDIIKRYFDGEDPISMDTMSDEEYEEDDCEGTRIRINIECLDGIEEDEES